MNRIYRMVAPTNPSIHVSDDPTIQGLVNSVILIILSSCQNLFWSLPPLPLKILSILLILSENNEPRNGMPADQIRAIPPPLGSYGGKARGFAVSGVFWGIAPATNMSLRWSFQFAAPAFAGLRRGKSPAIQ